MITSQFLFALGTKICDKDVRDVRLVVCRVLDVDNSNNELYILKSDRGTDWMSAATAHEHFTVHAE